jgi:hypothetical protein
MSAKPGRKADVYGKCEHCRIVYPARADCYPCARRALAERDAARDELAELKGKWGFATLVRVVRELLATHYPAKIFTGQSGDAGPLFVVKLREAMVLLPARIKRGAR